jgi:hypothetical protein
MGGEERDYEPGKKVKWRKCHLLVDTEGLLIKAKVHAASVFERDGIKGVLHKRSGRRSRSRVSRTCGWTPDTPARGRAKTGPRRP